MTKKNIPSLKFLEIAVNALKTVDKQEEKWQNCYYKYGRRSFWRYS